MWGSGTKWTWDCGIITTAGGSATTMGGGPMLMFTLTSARAGPENPNATVTAARRHHHTLSNLSSCTSLPVVRGKTSRQPILFNPDGMEPTSRSISLIIRDYHGCRGKTDQSGGGRRASAAGDRLKLFGFLLPLVFLLIVSMTWAVTEVTESILRRT